MIANKDKKNQPFATFDVHCTCRFFMQSELMPYFFPRVVQFSIIMSIQLNSCILAKIALYKFVTYLTEQNIFQIWDFDLKNFLNRNNIKVGLITAFNVFMCETRLLSVFWERKSWDNNKLVYSFNVIKVIQCVKISLKFTVI